MMRFYQYVYALLIAMYRPLVRIFALFNYKIALGVKGRKGWRSNIISKIRTRRDDQVTYWFHCASLGEFELALPVIQALKRLTKKDVYVVVSFFSPSGYEARKDHEDIDLCTYLPVDTASNAEAIIDILAPQAIVLVKYDFWFFMLKEAHFRSIPVCVVGARFRREMIYFTGLKGFYKKVFKWIDIWFVQDQESMTLLREHGIDRIHYCGDTRVDRTVSIASMEVQFDKVLAWKQSNPVFIMGSVWATDLEVIAPLLSDIMVSHKVMIVPHEMKESFLSHIEGSFPDDVLRYSHIDNVSRPEKNKILIIDHVGDLAKLYRYGEIAYVGGAFGSGLHNIYEPLANHLPVIFGPKIHLFPEAGEVINQNIGKSIKNEEEFMSAWNFFQNEDAGTLRGRIESFLLPSRGASQKIVEIIETHIN